MHDAQHISIAIARPMQEVYDFASDPRNLPRWAKGLTHSHIVREGELWVAEGPIGKVRIRFAPRNLFGVMDHSVELPSGVVVYNPMRVIANGQGSEFIFTLLRQAEMTDEQFAADRKAVEADLRTLKALLESQATT